MKKSEALLKISQKLQKQMHLINCEIQRNNPKMLCDNLASRVMTVIEGMRMLPPEKENSWQYDLEHVQYAHEWDEEDE